MEALKLLFTTDIGLMSLFTIVFIVGMGAWFRRFFNKQIEAEETRGRR
jgi:Na+-transporting methylmalonyl-CoA/oxaloacetate decarboxylase gamma subunit